MPVDDRDAQRTAADRAWSEFNHNVAGLFVLAMGLLAILYATGRARWARHWPLIFLGLAGFLLIRNDPGAWPLGPLGFWESMAYPEVLQHRVFVLLVVAFAFFEWMVRTGRLRSLRAVGVALFAVLVATNDPAAILASIVQFSWRLAIVLCFPVALVMVFDTLGWQFAFLRDAVAFRTLLGVRLAGEAFNLVTPTAE